MKNSKGAAAGTAGGATTTFVTEGVISEQDQRAPRQMANDEQTVAEELVRKGAADAKRDQRQRAGKESAGQDQE